MVLSSFPWTPSSLSCSPLRRSSKASIFSCSYPQNFPTSRNRNLWTHENMPESEEKRSESRRRIKAYLVKLCLFGGNQRLQPFSRSTHYGSNPEAAKLILGFDRSEKKKPKSSDWRFNEERKGVEVWNRWKGCLMTDWIRKFEFSNSERREKWVTDPRALSFSMANQKERKEASFSHSSLHPIWFLEPNNIL